MIYIVQSQKSEHFFYIQAKIKINFAIYILYTKWKKSHFSGWPLVTKGHVIP